MSLWDPAEKGESLVELSGSLWDSQGSGGKEGAGRVCRTWPVITGLHLSIASQILLERLEFAGGMFRTLPGSADHTKEVGREGGREGGSEGGRGGGTERMNKARGTWGREWAGKRAWPARRAPALSPVLESTRCRTLSHCPDTVQRRSLRPFAFDRRFTCPCAAPRLVSYWCSLG